MSLADSFMTQINQNANISPSKDSQRATEELANKYVLGLSKIYEADKRSQRLVSAEVGEEFDRDLHKNWKEGSLKIREVDFEDLFNRVYHSAKHGSVVEGRRNYRNQTLQECFDKIRDGEVFRQNAPNEAIREHLVDGLSISQFGRYVESCVRLGTFEFCESPDYSQILSLVNRTTVSCNQTELMSNFVHVDSDTVDDWQVEDEETPFLGIQEPCRIGYEQPCKIKYAFALKRELFCGDIGEQIRALIRQGAAHLDRKMAKHIVKLMFDCYADPTKARWRMSLDGVKWNTYYQQVCDGSLPWENLWYNCEDFDCDNRGLWCAIENAFDDVRNPVTGEPMTCCRSFNMIGTGRKQAFDIRQSLSPRTIEAAVKNESKSVMLNEPAREGFNPNVLWSPAIRECLRQCIAEQFPCWDKHQVRQSMDRTTLVGCPREAFTMTVQWEREVLERSAPNTWEYFNQEIVYMVKYMEKVGLSPVQPWAVQLIKGWPDGIEKPQAMSCTGPVDAPILG